MTTIGGIIRVSNKAQARDSDSPANQRQVLAQQGATRFYEDVGSGYSLERRRSSAAWQQLISDIKTGQVQRLLATDISRAARRDALLTELIELCDQQGVDFLAGGMTLSHGSAHQWYSAKQIGLVAELYSRDLSDRIRRGKQAALERGICAVCSKALPWHLMREPGTKYGVIKHPERWDDARHVVVEYIEGRARLDAMCEYIYERHGIMSHNSAMHRWLRSCALEGHYGGRNGELRLANCFPPLISPEEATMLRRRMEANRKRWGTSSNHKVHSLSGLCRCSHCGLAMKYSSRVKGVTPKLYEYMFCDGRRDCPAYRKRVRAHLVEEALVHQLDQGLLARQAATTKETVPLSPEVVVLRQRIAAMESLLAQMDSPGVRADLEQAKVRLHVLEEAFGREGSELVDQAKLTLMRGINHWMEREPGKRNADLLLLVDKAQVNAIAEVRGSGWETRLVPEVTLR